MAADDVSDSQVEEEEVTTEDGEEVNLQEALKKVVQVDVAEAGVLRKTLTVTVPWEQVHDELDKDYRELISDSTVPGFRRGRAPRRLVEKRFGEEVGEQVRTRIVSSAYLAAVEKEGLKVLGDPLVWVRMKDKRDKEGAGEEQLLDLQKALQHMELPDGEELSFRCEVEVKPEFELPELEGVPVERPKLSISTEDVTAQIDRVRAQRGHWAPVVDGKVAIDDLLVCDLKMVVAGKEVKAEENVQIAARGQVVEGVPLEDLGEKLKGAKPGDRRTVKATVPDDIEIEDLRGKEAEFTLTVRDIKRLQLPPLDKAYLTSLGFDDEKEYRSFVKQQMEGQLDHEIRRGMRNQVRNHLLEKTELVLPEGLSARQAERAVLRKMIDLRRRGVPEAEIEKHGDALRTSALQEAVSELKLHFVLERIAEKLEIEVTEEEINSAIASIARAYNRRFDRVKDELAKHNGIESLYLEIRDEKCVDQILEKALVTEAKVPKKTGAKKKTAAKTAKAEKKEETGTKTAKTRSKKKSTAK